MLGAPQLASELTDNAKETAANVLYGASGASVVGEAYGRDWTG